MPDVFTQKKRSQVMASIKGKENRTTELRFISLLRKAGITGWRRNYPLFGKPDFTFAKKRLVVFIDGDFWHGHPKTYRAPSGNAEYWSNKVQTNKRRDRKVTKMLTAKGWKVIRIWESSLKKRPYFTTCRILKLVES